MTRPAVGSRIGPYEILANLGAGGMGEVYRARDPRIGREVAIKVLPAALAADEDRLRRFEQEARATGTLNHPNLLVIFDFGSHEESPFIVSELLEGSTLREVLDNGRLPLRKVLHYGVQIANGLAAAHEKGVIHRDLKPENIFITRDDRVKLLDFGLAKIEVAEPHPKSRAQTERRGTSPGMVVGTVGYMSPEQVRGTAVDHRSDIFSFGIVLHEMITGNPPFRRDSSVETMNAILHDDAPALKEDVPPVLGRLLQHALEKTASHRFESAKDVAFALDAISSSGETSAVKTKSKSSRPKTERPKEVAYTRITFRRGLIMTARFAPDGSIVYGAAWEDKPLEIFSSNPASPESRPIGVPSADVLAVSPGGDLALSLGRRYVAGYITSGTLARMPIGVGAPRPLCEDVQDAAWMPDGKELIITRQVGGKYRIESPIDNVIFETPRWISNVRPSPKGDRIAFVDHLLWGDDGGGIVVIDRSGKEVVRQENTFGSTAGIAWTPKGDEVWIAGQSESTGRNLIALQMSGKERLVLSVPGRLTLHDLDAAGRALVSVENARRETVAGRHGEAQERNLSWFDWSWLSDLSYDGKLVALTEQAAAVRSRNTVYVRPTDGSPAVQIGEGHARGKSFSRDGKWIVAADTAAGVQVLPIGAGQPRTVPLQQIERYLSGQIFPDMQRLVVLGNEPGQPMHLYEVRIDGSAAPRRISDAVVGWPAILSNDGQHAVAMGADDRALLIPIAGGEPRTIDSCGPGDIPINWTTDDRALWIGKRGRVSLTVERAEIEGSARSEWHTIRPADPAGILDIFPVHMTPDGKTYAYSYRRSLSDLYVATGLL
jgi:serine/threonine protein kinase/Tol biopolymer transport system component